MTSTGSPAWNIPSAKTLIYLLLPLLFLLIVFPTAIQPHHEFISDYHDALCLILPDYFLMHNPFALWNNLWLTGLSDIASMNTDRFYPLSFPFYLFSQDLFIINLILLLHLYIAYLAFYKLGGLLVKNSDLLFLFSLGYMFSGVLLSRILVGHIFFVYAMAWIPLLFYFFLKITYKSEPSPLNIVGLALCETMLVFNASTYYLFFCNVILGIFFLYYFFRRRISKSQWIAILVALALFALISAVKLIPNFVGLAFIQRIDIIDPLADGGLLENNLASFIFGTPIDNVFGPYETMALIGIIPVLFAIIALIWGDREITIPSFCAMVFALIWADGGRILLSFIHLLPLVNSFRNAGRIFGAIMPILLLMSIYGVYLVLDKLRKGEPFTVSEDQKRMILYGVGVLAAVKVMELPWFSIPSLETALAVILVLGFILMIYLDRASILNIQCYCAIALLINAIILAKDFSLLNTDVLVKGVIIAVLLITVLLVFNRTELKGLSIKKHFLIILLVAGILLSVTANISVLKPSDPQFDKSPAIKIIEKIKEYPSNNPQIWVFENGWPIQHMDFTYWFIVNGIHPMRAFYSYVPLNTPPLVFQLNDTYYYTADYVVDNAYLENGNQNIPEVTFKVDNISVYRPDHVLSNVFVIRNGEVVPASYEKFTPDEIVVSGQFKGGDIAVVKTAYYPGWKVNNNDAELVSSMPGSQLRTDTSTITFRYDPWDFKIGIILTAIGVLCLIALYVRRKDFERYLNNNSTKPQAKKAPKDRKST